jgi:hypothetical protein
MLEKEYPKHAEAGDVKPLTTQSEGRGRGTRNYLHYY